MNDIQNIITERVDDIPPLLEQMQRMDLSALIDHYFPAHGNWHGLSPGQVGTIWLSSILSRGDHRPDLPQVKVMQAVLDPLAMSLATDVVSGERADDPLYVPCIARVQHSLGRNGLLFVGDCEIAGLEWRDVDRDAEVIRPRPEASKTHEGRVLVLDGELRAVIDRRWEVREVSTPGGDYVISRVFHRKWNPIGDIRKAWKTACRKGGVPGKRFHDLRRTSVRNMVRTAWLWR